MNLLNRDCELSKNMSEVHRLYSFNCGRWLLAAVLGCLLVFGSVDAYSASPSPSAETNHPAVPQSSVDSPKESKRKATTFPTTLSKLDGWHGMKLVKEYKGADVYCSFEFPKRFGLRDSEERKLLLTLIRFRHRVIKVDIDCYLVSYDSAYRQLFRLATVYQDADSARWFVMPKGAYDGLNLDGEWAETYNLTYRPKVLIDFQDVRRLISSNEESQLADEICAVFRSSPEAYLDGAGVGPVIQSLERKGMNSLADKLSHECGIK